MSTSAIAIAIVVVIGLIIVAAIVAVAMRSRRSQRLRRTFGPEYERVVAERGDRGRAETELESRQKRRQRLEIRPLDEGARDRYGRQWQQVQAEFVDAPSEAVRNADRLVIEVMRERGYPTEDFEQRAADVSVDHPAVVADYQAAHRISLLNRENRASTEDLRLAMKHYRSLFEDLLGKDERPAAASSERPAAEAPRESGEAMPSREGERTRGGR